MDLPPTLKYCIKTDNNSRLSIPEFFGFGGCRIKKTPCYPIFITLRPFEKVSFKFHRRGLLSWHTAFWRENKFHSLYKFDKSLKSLCVRPVNKVFFLHPTINFYLFYNIYALHYFLPLPTKNTATVPTPV